MDIADKVEAIKTDGGEAHFYGPMDIQKPLLVDAPVDAVAAYSATVPDGKRLTFTAEQVSEVKDMAIVKRPKWLSAITIRLLQCTH